MINRKDGILKPAGKLVTQVRNNEASGWMPVTFSATIQGPRLCKAVTVQIEQRSRRSVKQWQEYRIEARGAAAGEHMRKTVIRSDFAQARSRIDAMKELFVAYRDPFGRR
jgi:hypothetical protein